MKAAPWGPAAGGICPKQPQSLCHRRAEDRERQKRDSRHPKAKFAAHLTPSWGATGAETVLLGASAPGVSSSAPLALPCHSSSCGTREAAETRQPGLATATAVW